MNKITEPSDVFESKTLQDCESTEGYLEIETLFCDSSGYGRYEEPALNRQQLIHRIAGLMEENGQIYTAITDMGSFQVYITVYKKEK